MNKIELYEILAKHELWLRGEIGGERADLRDADLSGADLRGADLRGTDLSGADLSGADLRHADLNRAKFDDHIITLDRIDSVKRRTTYNITQDIIWCGCFKETFDEWVAKIRKTYPKGNDVFRKEYEAAIVYFKAVAEANGEKRKVEKLESV